MGSRQTATAAGAFLAVILIVGWALPTIAAEAEPEVDLVVVKADSKDPVEPGEQFSYEITGTNNGPSGAAAVFVVDSLPNQVEFVSADSGCAYSAGSHAVECSIGSLAPGASFTRTVTAQVKPGARDGMRNVVVIENREDPQFAPVETDPRNNRDVESTDIVIGSIGDFVWEDTNADGVQDPGEPGLSGVRVRLTGPAGTRTATTDGAGLYLFDALVSGAYEVQVLPATAPAGYRPTTPVSVTVALAPGQDFRDADFGFVPPRAPVIDLELAKDVSPDLVVVGADTTFTITLTNQGPDDATGVVVGDALPAGLTLVSHDGGASFDPGDLTWTVGNLAAGATRTLTFVVTAGAAGTYTNVAQVTGANEPDADSTPGNDDPSEDDQDDATVEVSAVQAATLIGDEVFFDADQDGVRDANEAGIEGATVTITRVSDGQQLTDTTDANGLYLFTSFPGEDSFPEGDYRVEVAVPAVAGSGLTRLTTPAAYDVTVVLDADDRFESLTNDFGFVLRLGDFVWYDDDQDGVQDADEQGIPNVELILQDANGNELGRVRTNSSGIYGFALPPGTYRVVVNTATLPAFVEFPTSPRPAAHTKTLATGDVLTADFGFCGSENILPCTGLTAGSFGMAGLALVLVGGLMVAGTGRRVRRALR